jgi:Ran GTPase-activating protein (RanGAP) involved in mRNA processing and transport
MIESVKMSIEGVCELASMLCMNKKLRYLSMNHNEIGDQSIHLLADALQYNKTLQYLYLNNCNLRDGCVPSIVDIIEQSRTLISIELVKNQLTNEDKFTINQAASTNEACSIYLDFTFQRIHS